MVKIIVFAYLWLVSQVVVLAAKDGTTPAPNKAPSQHTNHESPKPRTTKKPTVLENKPTKQENLSSNDNNRSPKTQTHKPHQQPTKLTKQQADTRYRNCHGWCFRDVWKPLGKPPKSTSGGQNSEQKRRIDELQSAVNQVPYFPITAKFNLFADSHQYKDRSRRLLRSKLFDKNVLKIPGDVFYPYTRRALHAMLTKSGIAHDPLQVRSAPPAIRMRKKTEASGYNTVDNGYFNSNPLLDNVLSEAERKALQTKSEEKDDQGDVDGDEDGKQEENEESDANGALFNRRDDKGSNIKSRALDLDDFVFGKNKQRSKLQKSSPMELLGVFGPHQQETMLVDPPENAVDDVVAGMKITGKDSGTFLIGSTKHARSNLIKWMGPNVKSRSKLLSDKTGLVVEGQTKKKAIDRLLKAMTNNYQYKPKTADPRHQKRCFGFGFGWNVAWNFNWGCGCGFCSFGCCC